MKFIILDGWLMVFTPYESQIVIAKSIGVLKAFKLFATDVPLPNIPISSAKVASLAIAVIVRGGRSTFEYCRSRTSPVAVGHEFRDTTSSRSVYLVRPSTILSYSMSFGSHSSILFPSRSMIWANLPYSKDSTSPIMVTPCFFSSPINQSRSSTL